jgi:hypothetical protein
MAAAVAAATVVAAAADAIDRVACCDSPTKEPYPGLLDLSFIPAGLAICKVKQGCIFALDVLPGPQ